jgi:hypothetical protein
MEVAQRHKKGEYGWRNWEGARDEGICARGVFQFGMLSLCKLVLCFLNQAKWGFAKYPKHLKVGKRNSFLSNIGGCIVHPSACNR